MKCSNHPDKDAAAMCERCNLLYCGNCALSSNGKCPKCGNPLRSPQSVPSYEISQQELYKGKGQPRILEAVSSLYVEPERAIRRLKEYPSLLTGVVNLAVLYFFMLALWIIFLVVIALVPTTFGINAQPNLFDVKNIFAFLIVNIFYFGVSILGWLLASLIHFLPAKLLGGKGEYVQQACILSYIMLAMFPLWIFAMVLGAVPVFGLFIALVANLLILSYTLFLIFLGIREVNEFNTVKAIISFVISLAITAFLAFLLAVLLVLIFAMPIIGNLPYPSF
ncbi:YIP1 family protein [Candidatus Micrarchaeota archaeon]|nr:YIP1 family protein [Candidatus Micrarchaeota archaeon]